MRLRSLGPADTVFAPGRSTPKLANENGSYYCQRLDAGSGVLHCATRCVPAGGSLGVVSVSAWSVQRVLSCLLWMGLAMACAWGGSAEAASRRDAADVVVQVATNDAAVPLFDAPACDAFATGCPSVPGDRHTDEPMKRRHVARRALPVVDEPIAFVQDIAPVWAVLPDIDDALVVLPPSRGVLPAMRTTRNALRRRHLRVIGGRAPPASA